MNYLEWYQSHANTWDEKLIQRSCLLFAAASLVTVPLQLHSTFWAKKIEASAENTLNSIPKIGRLEAEIHYLEAFDKSSLFGSVVSGSASAALLTSISEAAKDYRLKGVIMAGSAEAIVEDVKAQKTIFVTEGGSLGELTVKTIREGELILEYLGGEIKLNIQ